MQKKNRIFVILILMIFFSHGCAGLQKTPVGKTYFDLDTGGTVLDSHTSCDGDALLVKEFFINPAFDSHAFVYRVGTNEYTTDYYNEFVTYPARIITERIQESLCKSSRFKLTPTHLKQQVSYRLSGKITRLYADVRDPAHPTATIEIRMILENKRAERFEVLSSRTWLAKEPVLSRSPSHLVAGWNAGLAKIIHDFIREVQTIDP